MMTAEHRRPFAAFVLVFAFACFVLGNGLREQVVRVFVESGAPRPLISAVVPDIVLGQSLHHAPPAPKPTLGAVLASPPQESRRLTATPVTAVVTSSPAAPARPHRGAPHHGHKSHATPAKPKHAATTAAVHVKHPTTPSTPSTPATPTTPVAPSTPTTGGGGIVRPPSSGPKGLNAVGTNSSTGSHHSWSGGHHHSTHHSTHHGSGHFVGGPTKHTVSIDRGDHRGRSDHQHGGWSHGDRGRHDHRGHGTPGTHGSHGSWSGHGSSGGHGGWGGHGGGRHH